MFACVSILTMAIFSVGFTLYSVNTSSEEAINEVYEVLTARDMNFFDEDELERLLYNLSEEYDAGIQVEMTSNHLELEPYVITATATESDLAKVFDLRLPELVGRFFSDGTIIKYEKRHYNVSQEQIAYYEIKLAQNLRKANGELWYLLLVLFVSQVIGLTIVSFLGSYRLRKVFRPIYNMTKTAEKISINDMDAKLDVTKAEYELKDLALTFNDMLDRIRTDYDKQKKVCFRCVS